MLDVFRTVSNWTQRERHMLSFMLFVKTHKVGGTSIALALAKTYTDAGFKICECSESAQLNEFTWHLTLRFDLKCRLLACHTTFSEQKLSKLTIF